VAAQSMPDRMDFGQAIQIKINENKNKCIIIIIIIIISVYLFITICVYIQRMLALLIYCICICHRTSVPSAHYPVELHSIKLSVKLAMVSIICLYVCLAADCGFLVRSFGQWAAANCVALPTANAGQYITSHCKPLLFRFSFKRHYVRTFNL